MKANKIYAILLGCVFAFGLSSCVKTAPEYVPGEKDTASCTVGLDVSMPTNLELSGDPVEVFFERNDANGALDVNVTIVDDSGLFSLESNTVSFANGEKRAKANVVYDYDKLDPKDSYYFEVNMASKELASLYKAVTIPFNCVKAWKNLGVGQFYDPVILDDSEGDLGIVECEIRQSPDGALRYRIMNPYADVERRAMLWGDDAAKATPCEYIEFWVVDEDTMQVTWDGFWLTGIWYNGKPGADIKAYLPSALNKSYASEDEESGYADDDVVQIAARYYIDGLGGFGLNYCYLSMPGGPDLEEWLMEE